MESNKIFKKFGELIQQKIDRRNMECDKTPQNLNLIKWMDNEIDLLLQVELSVIEMMRSNSLNIIKCRRESFLTGVESGKLEYKTGRVHPEYIM
jgi:restriction endonuclease